MAKYLSPRLNLINGPWDFFRYRNPLGISNGYCLHVDDLKSLNLLWRSGWMGLSLSEQVLSGSSLDISL